MAQGVGYTLYKEFKSDEGKIQNPDFRDYKISRAHEMDFPIDLAFIETEDSFGTKGVADAALVSTTSANAIYYAVGVRQDHRPPRANL